MEQKGAAFHKRVREGYLHQAERWPDRYLVVDAREPQDVVTAAMLDGMRTAFS